MFFDLALIYQLFRVTLYAPTIWHTSSSNKSYLMTVESLITLICGCRGWWSPGDGQQTGSQSRHTSHAHIPSTIHSIMNTMDARWSIALYDIRLSFCWHIWSSKHLNSLPKPPISFWLHQCHNYLADGIICDVRAQQTVLPLRCVVLKRRKS